MSLTLGEKLRQAREDKGISVAEVAEQTRIAPLYIESIDNDDYRALPGGIFNRGFIKSYAKYVGIDEQEALADYARLLTETEGGDVEEVKTYRPQVLTDDRATHSMIPTLILAVIILGLMTGGVLFLVSYLRQPATPSAEPATKTHVNSANINSAVESNINTQSATSNVPEMATSIFEVSSVSQPIQITTAVDVEDPKRALIAAGSSVTFTAKETLTLSYLRWIAGMVQLTINGKPINLPTEPLDSKDKDRIVFTISKNNLEQILTSGSISRQVSPVTQDTNANVDQPSTQSAVPGPTTPSPKPSVSANTTVRPSNTNRSTALPRPSATVKSSVSTRPAANRPQ